MIFKLTTLVAVFLFSASALAQVDNDDLRDIYELVEGGQYAEALAAHRNFFQASRQAPGMAGVRLSFALSHWAQLGKVYPPAQEALQSLRLSLGQTLKAGKGDFTTMAEYDSINELVGQRTDTVEVFRYVDEHHPEKAGDYYHAVKDALIAAGEYQLVMNYLGDPVYAYENARHHREFMMSRIRQGKTSDRAYADSTYQQEVQALLAVTQSLELNDVAEEIQKRHRQYMNSQ